MLPVEPSFVEPSQHIEHDLCCGGVPPQDAAWLARFIASRAYAGRSVDLETADTPDLLLLRLDRPVKAIVSAFGGTPSRHVALFNCLLSLPTISPRYLFDSAKSASQASFRDRSDWSTNTDLLEFPEDRIRRRGAIVLRVLREFLRAEHAIDFNEGLATYEPGSGQVSLESPVVLIAGTLLRLDRIDPLVFLDCDRVVNHHPESYSSLQSGARPFQLEFWFDAANSLQFQAWPWIRKFMSKLPTEKLGAFALAAYKTFHYWLLDRSRNHMEMVQRIWIFDYGLRWLDPAQQRQWRLPSVPIPQAQVSQDYSKALRSIAKMLGEKLADRKEDALLRTAWMIYSWRGYFGREKLLADEMRKSLVGAASEMMGKLRVYLEAGDPQALIARREQCEVALRVLASFGSLFRCIKPLLLALRCLKVPSVATDLRYWHEENRPNPPEPWRWIPEWMTAFTHAYARYASKKDPDLKEFRADFVQFCLDRLKSQREDGTDGNEVPKSAQPAMIEKSPVWRYACVRAIRELDIKPRDRGDFVLKWSAANDPDESVRQAARVAYDELCLPTTTLEPDRKSTRRGIIAAYWWMRQAHLAELNAEIDKQGANRTFRLEVRRGTQRKEAKTK